MKYLPRWYLLPLLMASAALFGYSIHLLSERIYLLLAILATFYTFGYVVGKTLWKKLLPYEPIHWITYLCLGLSTTVVVFNWLSTLGMTFPVPLIKMGFGGLFLYSGKLIYDERKSYLTHVFKTIRNPYRVFVLFLVTVCIYLFWGPLREFIVAPLHDPVMLSMLSQDILNGGFSFDAVPNARANYPAGFAWILALNSGIFNMESSESIVFMTNLFNILILLATYQFGLKLFNNNLFALLLAVIVVFYSNVPSNLFAHRGKNA